MDTILGIAGVFILTQFCKSWIKPKWGDTGIHVFAFLVALIIVIVRGFMTAYPTFGEMVVTAGTYLVASLSLYQIIIKPLSNNLNL